MSEEDKMPDWKGYGIDQAVVERWIRKTFGDKIFETRKSEARAYSKRRSSCIRCSRAIRSSRARRRTILWTASSRRRPVS